MPEAISTEQTAAKRATRLRWYYRNREKANASNKKWIAENRDRKREAQKLYYEKRKEDPDYKAKKNAQARRWKQKHPKEQQARAKSYRENRREHLKEVSRRNHLKRKHKLTVAAYEAMLLKQSGRCAICQTDDPAPLRVLSVDHDHATGAVRGLLCLHCNAGLGHFRDEPDLLKAALAYLEAAAPC